MKTIHIYSDESRHRNERFLLLSGLWIEESNIKVARNQIMKLRHKHGYINSSEVYIDFAGELKWTKISDKYLSIYRELVDIFFEWIEDDIARYCCMLVDTNNRVIKQHNNINTDGYFKLLYQLYYQNSKIPAIYKIFPDRISNPTIKINLPMLDKCLDTGFLKKFSHLMNPDDIIDARGFVNNITPIDSKSSGFIQIIDVIMGAIGYFQNGLFRNPGAKKAKIELMKHVFEKIILSGVIKFSGKKFLVAKSTKFNIWIFKPSKNKICPQ